jgi:hypothetical protein
VELGLNEKESHSNFELFIKIQQKYPNHRRRIWHIVRQFNMPYILALGLKSTGYHYLIYDQDKQRANILNQVPKGIVQTTIIDLQREQKVSDTNNIYVLLNKDVGFRLKEVCNQLYELLIKDIMKMSRNARMFIGQDLRECMSRIFRYIYSYSLSQSCRELLVKLSIEADILKQYLVTAYTLQHITIKSFNHRITLSVELGALVGGLLKKQL